MVNTFYVLILLNLLADYITLEHLSTPLTTSTPLKESVNRNICQLNDYKLNWGKRKDIIRIC